MDVSFAAPPSTEATLQRPVPPKRFQSPFAQAGAMSAAGQDERSPRESITEPTSPPGDCSYLTIH